MQTSLATAATLALACLFVSITLSGAGQTRSDAAG